MDFGAPNGIRDLWIRSEHEPENSTIRVQKQGAQSGVTQGELMPVPADLAIAGMVAAYTGGWWVYKQDGSRFADRGDSGAFVVDADRRVVGMLVAIDPDLGAAYVHGVKQIFKALQVELR
ncbi:MAG: hypothetical protein ACP5H2_12690 [Solirubrobacteraceae bacterium]